MADPITAYLTNLGFPQVMLWMLSFAALYGLMSQAQVPKDKPSRAIISIAAAFFVIIAAPTSLVNVLEKMSQSLIVMILGLLVMIVFLEVAGLKHKGKLVVSKEGIGYEHGEGFSYLEYYGKYFAVIIIVIAILIFIGAGGMGLLGFNIAFSGVNTMTLLIFIVIVLAVTWMIFGKSGEK